MTSLPTKSSFLRRATFDDEDSASISQGFASSVRLKGGTGGTGWKLEVVGTSCIVRTGESATEAASCDLNVEVSEMAEGGGGGRANDA